MGLSSEVPAVCGVFGGEDQVTAGERKRANWLCGGWVGWCLKGWSAGEERRGVDKDASSISSQMHLPSSNSNNPYSECEELSTWNSEWSSAWVVSSGIHLSPVLWQQGEWCGGECLEGGVVIVRSLRFGSDVVCDATQLTWARWCTKILQSTS